MSESKVIIHVTEEDIKQAKQALHVHPLCGRSRLCPVAQAINRELEGVRASVANESVTLTLAGRCTRARLPSSVSERIAAFDQHDRMEPFEFELAPPEPSRQQP